MARLPGETMARAKRPLVLSPEELAMTKRMAIKMGKARSYITFIRERYLKRVAAYFRTDIQRIPLELNDLSPNPLP
jgi:hypothetical protein